MTSSTIIIAAWLFLFAPIGATWAQNPPPRAAPQRPRSAQGDFDSFSKRAAAARDANRIHEAVGLYQKALKLNPRWEEGWWYLGTLLYDSDQYAEGVMAFRNLVGLKAKMGPAWALLGLCEFETRDYKNSLIHLERGRSLGLAGNDELVNVTRYHEALLLNARGEFESSTQLLFSLVARGVVSENVKVALGLATLRVPILPSQVDPSKDALIHAVGEVATLVGLNNFDQAVEGFERALNEYPDTPFLHYAYGTALVALSRYDEAGKEFREEMKITPESAMPYMQLAFLQLRTRRFQEAFPVAQTAVRLAPNSFPAHYLVGRTLLELGKIEDSIKELETARRLGPFSPEVRYNLARAYAKAQRNEEAARERKEFARLNALFARRQLEGGAQSYRSSSDRGTLEPHELGPPPAPPQK